MNYIIDFERINQLTAHPSDAPGQMGPLLHYKISRKYIDMYLEVYYRGEKNGKKYDEAVNTLLYNKILIDLRDQKIEKILQDESDCSK